MNLHVIACFLTGALFQSPLVNSHFTAFPHEHPHKDNIYHNPQAYQYQPQPAQHPEPAYPYVAPHPTPVKPHEPAYRAEAAPAPPHETAYHAQPTPAYAHQQPYHQHYGYHVVQQPGHYQEPRHYQHPEPYQPHPDPAYQQYQPYHQPQPVYPAHPQPSQPLHKPAKEQVTTPAPEPEETPVPETTAVAEQPKYLGTFKNPSHDVEGDIFMLDQSTLYIQGFSFDGQAPDAYFWSDGIPIPYYTRSNPNVAMNLKKYHKEDVVLMLPPEKPTLEALGHFQIWCNMFNVVFGEFDMKDSHHG